jgi:cytochrome c-type biogenesis protein CcmF
MIAEFGAFALILALAFAIAQLALSAGAGAGARPCSRRPAKARRCAPSRRGAGLRLPGLRLRHLGLLVANVAQNSHTEKPLLYRVAGAWGSHEGSMLLWCLALTGYGAAAVAFGRSLPRG